MRRRRLVIAGRIPPPPIKRKRLGTWAKVAIALVLLFSIGGVLGYQYVMDYIRSLAEQVEVEVIDVRLTVYHGRAALNVTLAVTNPTDFDVKISKVAFDVKYLGSIVGTGQSVEEFTLPPHKRTEIWLLVLPRPGETFYTMLEGLTRGKIWIRVDGTIYATAKILGIFDYNVVRPITLYRTIEVELPISMEVGKYINITSMEVLPGHKIRVTVQVTNPFVEAAEPLPLNVTDVELTVFINDTFFGSGRLEEPIEIPPKGMGEGTILLNTTDEAIRQVVSMALESGSQARGILIRTNGTVTVQLYDIVISRPFEHEMAYELGPGVSIEEAFNFQIVNMTYLGPVDGYQALEVWAEVTLVAPRIPIQLSMSYNVTEFRMDIYDNKGKKIGYVELLEPIQAELANITRPAHLLIYIDEDVFEQTFMGTEGTTGELSVSFVPKNLNMTIQIYETELVIQRAELDVPELMGFEVRIKGIQIPLDPNLIWRDRIEAHLPIVITNPSDYDVQIVSINGQPAIYFDLYCARHGTYLGYGALLRNVTIKAHDTRGILVPVIIENMEHIRMGHWYGGLDIRITFVVKNGHFTFMIFNAVLTIMFQAILPFG